MNAQELRKIGKELKDKYFESVLEDTHKRSIKLYTFSLDTERYLKRNQYTDEEIAIKAEEMYQENLEKTKATILTRYNPDLMAKHSSIINGIDLRNICKDMEELDYEMVRYLKFDKDGNYLGNLEASSHESIVPLSVFESLTEEIKNDENIASAIMIHNHPHSIPAIISFGDKKVLEMIEHEIGDKLSNFCIITKYDFYDNMQGQCS